jgi:hypothetical protein
MLGPAGSLVSPMLRISLDKPAEQNRKLQIANILK